MYLVTILSSVLIDLLIRLVNAPEKSLLGRLLTLETPVATTLNIDKCDSHVTLPVIFVWRRWLDGQRLDERRDFYWLLD